MSNSDVKHEEHSHDFAKSKYNHISFELRKELIRSVEEDGISIYRASRMLGIKNCTAKVILRQYRRKGHIFKRRSETRRKQRNSPPTPSRTFPRETQSEPQVPEEPIPVNPIPQNYSWPINYCPFSLSSPQPLLMMIVYRFS